MDKILVTIYVLSIDEQFDIFLPIGKSVSVIIDYIQDSIVDLSNNNYIKKEGALLYLDNGLVVNPNNVIKYSGIKNGSKLCLI